MNLRIFRPLRLSWMFENQPYRLGEDICVHVELKPRRDVRLREGRIELVCEEDYIETSVEMMNNLSGGSHGTNMGTSAVPLMRVPKRITKRQRNRFIHSSVVFISDAQLRAKSPSQHLATLSIEPEAPARYSDGDVTWTLEIVVDVVGSRDITEKMPISITVS